MADAKNNTGIDNSGNKNSGNKNSGSKNSGNWNSGSKNSGNKNSGNKNSGYRNSGDWNSGDWNSGDWNSGDWNSGYSNSGYGNSGDWNSGVFNTIEPDAMFFNKPTSIKLSKYLYSDAWPNFSEMKPCVWVEESIMTEAEKTENPTYKTTGGFIRKLEYKEAWAVFWRKTSAENKAKVLALPNFDAEVFKEITGIDTKENSEAKQKAKELEDEAQKLLDKAKELRNSL